MKTEIDNIRDRYARRALRNDDGRYSMLHPDVWQRVQERQRALIELLTNEVDKPLKELLVLELGCGNGANLLELIHLGLSPGNICGNELLPERLQTARANLPLACELHLGDANYLGFPSNSFDIVYQSTVFSSILDQEFRKQLAIKVWQWVRPGGGVLWYDLAFDNPNNPDVEGIPLARIRELFPEGTMHAKKVTLAPPISRRVTKIHPSLYTLFNTFPYFRTHILCFITK